MLMRVRSCRPALFVAVGIRRTGALFNLQGHFGNAVLMAEHFQGFAVQGIAVCAGRKQVHGQMHILGADGPDFQLMNAFHAV